MVSLVSVVRVRPMLLHSAGPMLPKVCMLAKTANVVIASVTLKVLVVAVTPQVS